MLNVIPRAGIREMIEIGKYIENTEQNVATEKKIPLFLYRGQFIENVMNK